MGLELPIDHFRLLGVGPASDAQTVLRTLQQRLDRVPDQGFTADTLLARAELLRASADLLSDPERRADYEADITALAGREGSLVPALDIPSTREVAGLLLLLEANQPQECFEKACRCLQPPQAPALGSSREADLTLLAGLSCLGAAAELRDQRHYEAAARTLQQGLQLLQRMGQLPDQREAMSRDLERLTPYRVLDLLSRDLAAVEERREGLALLEQLVRRRGGLEGDGDPGFGRSEFQAFFKQIRGFLTVQEQIDLFSRWGREGSAAADFLATVALTASGFVQRKPARIATARDRLLASGRTGIDPLLANLYLLLGQVETAKARFAAGAGPELRAWAARQSEDPLAQVCAYCRDWLLRDVLPGYRDLEADPDLDAYFSDRDVVAWVEREDRRESKEPSPAATSSPLPPVAERFSWVPSTPLAGGTPLGGGSFGSQPSSLSPPFQGSGHAEEEEEGDEEEVGLRWRLPDGLPPVGPWLIGAIALLGVALVAGLWLLRGRTPSPPAPRLPPPRSETPAPLPPRAAGTAPKPAPAGMPPPAAAVSFRPLSTPSPSPPEVRSLLETWLAAKAAVLAGDPSTVPLERIARESQVEGLRRERAADEARGETQRIAVRVKDLTIRERSPQRIAVVADLAYSDSRRNASGVQVASTAPTTLRNLYVFGRDGGTWRLAATSAAD